MSPDEWTDERLIVRILVLQIEDGLYMHSIPHRSTYMSVSSVESYFPPAFLLR